MSNLAKPLATAGLKTNFNENHKFNAVMDQINDACNAASFTTDTVTIHDIDNDVVDNIHTAFTEVGYVTTKTYVGADASSLKFAW